MRGFTSTAGQSLVSLAWPFRLVLFLPRLNLSVHLPKRSSACKLLGILFQLMLPLKCCTRLVEDEKGKGRTLQETEAAPPLNQAFIMAT